MDKPPSSAPPQHRRYPRASPAPRQLPAALLVAGATARRWPRAVPDRRVFPRG